MKFIIKLIYYLWYDCKINKIIKYNKNKLYNLIYPKLIRLIRLIKLIKFIFKISITLNRSTKVSVTLSGLTWIVAIRSEETCNP